MNLLDHWKEPFLMTLDPSASASLSLSLSHTKHTHTHTQGGLYLKSIFLHYCCLRKLVQFRARIQCTSRVLTSGFDIFRLLRFSLYHKESKKGVNFLYKQFFVGRLVCVCVCVYMYMYMYIYIYIVRFELCCWKVGVYI